MTDILDINIDYLALDLDIAIGKSKSSTKWPNNKMTFGDFANRLKEVTNLPYTRKEYDRLSKEDQDKVKNVGGYVGGHLNGAKRSKKSVAYRQLITLDIDFAHLNLPTLVRQTLDVDYILHTTISHTEDRPRYRLIVPTTRDMSPDEYIAVSRRLASVLDIEMFDQTTYDPSRFMYWYATLKNAVTVYEDSVTGSFLDVDSYLMTYADWRDTSEWPVSSRERGRLQSGIGRQEDPTAKDGLIGAFCRAYTITEVIAELLDGIYRMVEPGRYTFTEGSGEGGVVTYDDKFSYSHHATDPASGMLCNAFDLIRMHKFGHLDTDIKTDAPQPSFAEMQKYAMKDPKVARVITRENLKLAELDFSDPLTFKPELEDLDWSQDLELTKSGASKATAGNLKLIFANDPRLKNMLGLNEFDNRHYLRGSVPWRRITRPEPLRNVDYAGVRSYLETIYGIVSVGKIEDALMLHCQRSCFHPVRDYLAGLTWDGEDRIDTLLTKVFGVEDNPYHAAVMRKFMAGAVARVFEPGCKFELVPVLVGGQGAYKSVFANKLGAEWFSDSVNSVTGKESIEQLQGAWIIELAELSAMRKAQVEAIKHYLSKREDTYRPAYARTVETFPRQSVFIGTTNDVNFLRDPTGNRRFLPVEVNERAVRAGDTINPHKDMTPDFVGQLWAEAFKLYKANEPLYLEDAGVEALAQIKQREFSDVDNRLGAIEHFLELGTPDAWETFDLPTRQLYMTNAAGDEETINWNARNEVCVASIWVECLGKDLASMDRYKTRELNEIMRNMDDWEEKKSTKNFGVYGTQRYFSRKKPI